MNFSGYNVISGHKNARRNPVGYLEYGTIIVGRAGERVEGNRPLGEVAAKNLGSVNIKNRAIIAQHAHVQGSKIRRIVDIDCATEVGRHKLVVWIRSESDGRRLVSIAVSQLCGP